MFTGIIEELGKIKSINFGADSAELFINATTVLQGTVVGDSICVNGVCLTVKKIVNNAFSADVMSETLKRSNLGSLKLNDLVNLERAMQMNGRFGGHIVSGHIDGTGKITKIQKSDIALVFSINFDEKLAKYIVKKGSIAIDGISLTIAEMGNTEFTISTIPHTLENTVLKTKTINDIVNLEVDVIGKYVEKLLLKEPEILNHYLPENSKSKITKEFLAENGFY